MMNEAMDRANGCPQQVLRLLPWFAEGDLSDEDRGAVEAHLASCRPCRDELSMIEGRADADVAELPSPDRVYARVQARIEGRASTETPSRETTRPPARVRSLRAPAIKPWLALAASITLAAVVGGVWMDREASVEPVYSTAAVDEAPVGAVPDVDGQLDVIFRGEITTDQMNRALRAIGGTVVAGPSDLGAYRIRLTGDGGFDVLAAARALRASDENAPGVAAFAEPVSQ